MQLGARLIFYRSAVLYVHVYPFYKVRFFDKLSIGLNMVLTLLQLQLMLLGKFPSTLKG